MCSGWQAESRGAGKHGEGTAKSFVARIHFSFDDMRNQAQDPALNFETMVRVAVVPMVRVVAVGWRPCVCADSPIGSAAHSLKTFE